MTPRSDLKDCGKHYGRLGEITTLSCCLSSSQRGTDIKSSSSISPNIYIYKLNHEQGTEIGHEADHLTPVMD